MVLFCLAGLLLVSREQIHTVSRFYQSCGQLVRNNGWWETSWNSYSDERFEKTFLISKTTFNFILSHIRHELER